MNTSLLTQCSGWINHPNLTQKRMDIRPDSVHTCYTIFSCKHWENCEHIQLKRFLFKLKLNWQNTNFTHTKFGFNLHKWLPLFHFNVFTLDYIFEIVCVSGRGAFWHNRSVNSSNVYDIIWIVTCTHIFYWVETTDTASLIIHWV